MYFLKQKASNTIWNTAKTFSLTFIGCQRLSYSTGDPLFDKQIKSNFELRLLANPSLSALLQSVPVML